MAGMEDFDIYEDDFEEVVPAKEDKSQLNQVVDNYKRILNGQVDAENYAS